MIAGVAVVDSHAIKQAFGMHLSTPSNGASFALCRQRRLFSRDGIRSRARARCGIHPSFRCRPLKQRDSSSRPPLPSPSRRFKTTPDTAPAVFVAASTAGSSNVAVSRVQRPSCRHNVADLRRQQKYKQRATTVQQSRPNKFLLNQTSTYQQRYSNSILS